MRLLVYYALEPDKQHFVNKPDLFGENVANSFPSTVFDIEEAGKCLAFSRQTACVFHLMRVLEIGLYSLARAIRIQKIEENWHNAIEQIERAIRNLPRGTPKEKEELAFYSDATAQLFSVKEAWRKFLPTDSGRCGISNQSVMNHSPECAKKSFSILLMFEGGRMRFVQSMAGIEFHDCLYDRLCCVLLSKQTQACNQIKI